MPRGQVINFSKQADAFLLFLERAGYASAKEAIDYLQISQSAFSRVVRFIEETKPGILLTAGKSVATRYAIRREIQGIGTVIPVYRIDETGKGNHCINLYPIRSKGFYVESLSKFFRTKFFGDFPYWLEDLRPSGFLGRLVPIRHPELEAPTDILQWSVDQSLKYLVRHGADLIGNLIVGDRAFQAYLQQTQRQEAIPVAVREKRYQEIVQDVLQLGDAGSSAGGEQPKFLTSVGSLQGPTPVIVKFSPPVTSELGLRWADLLICEHLAHLTLLSSEFEPARSQVLKAGDRMFLEVERFDRTSSHGRRGVISLRALDLEFVGSLGAWSQACEALQVQRRIDDQISSSARTMEIFGKLIANTDMHSGNLSFITEGEEILRLAPIYDMLPMAYSPRHNQIIDYKFTPSTPNPAHAQEWKKAWKLAVKFWKSTAEHTSISIDFRKIATENLKKVKALEELIKRLP